MSDGLNDDDFDSLAAEYVLGTLEADERTRANVLLDVDEAFRARVRQWDTRKEPDVAGKKRPKSQAQTKKTPTKPKRPKKTSRGK